MSCPTSWMRPEVLGMPGPSRTYCPNTAPGHGRAPLFGVLGRRLGADQARTHITRLADHPDERVRTAAEIHLRRLR